MYIYESVLHQLISRQTQHINSVTLRRWRSIGNHWLIASWMGRGTYQSVVGPSVSAAPRNQNTLSGQLKNKQILPFDFARWSRCPMANWHILAHWQNNMYVLLLYVFSPRAKEARVSKYKHVVITSEHVISHAIYRPTWPGRYRVSQSTKRAIG